MTTAQQSTSVGTMLTEEFLIPLGITQGELAESMAVDLEIVQSLCDDMLVIDAATAILLAKALGTTPEFWLNLQRICESEPNRNCSKGEHPSRFGF